MMITGVVICRIGGGRNTQEFDITGRSMKGWVMVDADGYAADADLKGWVQQGVAFAQTLDPK